MTASHHRTMDEVDKAKVYEQYTGLGPLHNACKNGSSDDVRKLLEQGETPYQTDEKGRTALHMAMRSATDVIEKIDLLLGRNPDLLNVKDDSGRSPLFEACLFQSATSLRHFMNFNPDLEAKENTGLTPLHYIIQNSSDLENKLEMFLSHAKDLSENLVNARDKTGKNLLEYACQDFKVSVPKLLLRHGARPDETNRSVLLSIIQHRKDVEETLELFLKNSGSHAADLLNFTSSTGVNIIDHCSMNLGFNRDILEILLRHGAKPNPKNIEVLRFLIRDAADEYHECDDDDDDADTGLLELYFKNIEQPLENRVFETDISVLRYVCQFNCVKIVEILIKNCIFPNTEKSNLLQLSVKGEVDVAKKFEVLLKYCPDLDISTSKKNNAQTRLHSTCLHGNAEAVRLLLQYGDDPYLVNANGEMPIHCALRSEETPLEKVKAFFEATKNADELMRKCCDTKKRSLLYQAIRESEAEAVKLFLDLGAKPDCNENLIPAIIKSKIEVSKKLEFLFEAHPHYDVQQSVKGRGETRLHLVCLHGSLDTVKMLLEHGDDPYLPNQSGETPIHYALESTTMAFEKLELFLSTADYASRTLQCEDRNGNSLLERVCRTQKIKFVNLLLDNGAIPYPNDNNLIETSIQSKLHVAIKLERLLQEYPDYDIMTSQKNDSLTRLHVVSRHGSLEAVKMLLEQGDDLHRLDKNGQSPIYYAVNSETMPLEKFELFLKMSNLIHNTGALFESILVGEKQVSDKLELLLKFCPNCDFLDSETGDTRLHIVCMHGSLEAIKLVLKCGDNPYSRNKKDETPVHYALRSKIMPLEKLELFLSTSSDICEFFSQCCDANGKSLLHQVFRSYSAKFAQLLIINGGQPNVHDGNLFHESIQSEIDVPEKLRLIVNAYPEYDIRLSEKNDGQTRLHVVCLCGNMGAVETLLRYGDNPFEPNKKGETPIHCVLSSKVMAIEKLQLIYSEVANVDKRLQQCLDKDGHSLLYRAFRQTGDECVKFLLDHGAKPQPNDGSLIKATIDSNNDVPRKLQLLFRAYPDYDITASENGASRLHVVCEHGYDETVDRLLCQGDDPFATDKEGEMPLHYALRDDDTDKLQLFLNWAAGMDQLMRRCVDKNGQSLLSRVCRENDEDALALLICCGAEPNITDENLFNLSVQSKKDVSRKLEILLDAFPDYDIPITEKEEGQTRLHVFCLHGSLKSVRRLLDQGDDPYIQNKRGETPIHWAIRSTKNSRKKLALCQKVTKDESKPMIQRQASTSVLSILFGMDTEGTTKALKRFETAGFKCPKGVKEMIEFLLSQNIDLNVPIYTLALATEHLSFSVCRDLMIRGASPDSAYDDGETALHCAVKKESEKKTRMLVDAGADKSIEWYGLNPFEFSLMYSSQQTLERLGPKLWYSKMDETSMNDMKRIIEKIKYKGESNLTFAVRIGNLDLVKIWAKATNIHQADGTGVTPAQLSFRHPRIREFMKELDSSLSDENDWSTWYAVTDKYSTCIRGPVKETSDTGNNENIEMTIDSSSDSDNSDDSDEYYSTSESDTSTDSSEDETSSDEDEHNEKNSGNNSDASIDEDNDSGLNDDNKKNQSTNSSNILKGTFNANNRVNICPASTSLEDEIICVYSRDITTLAYVVGAKRKVKASQQDKETKCFQDYGRYSTHRLELGVPNRDHILNGKHNGGNNQECKRTVSDGRRELDKEIICVYSRSGTAEAKRFEKSQYSTPKRETAGINMYSEKEFQYDCSQSINQAYVIQGTLGNTTSKRENTNKETSLENRISLNEAESRFSEPCEEIRGFSDNEKCGTQVQHCLNISCKEECAPEKTADVSQHAKPENSPPKGGLLCVYNRREVQNHFKIVKNIKDRSSLPQEDHTTGLSSTGSKLVKRNGNFSNHSFGGAQDENEVLCVYSRDEDFPRCNSNTIKAIPTSNVESELADATSSTFREDFYRMQVSDTDLSKLFGTQPVQSPTDTEWEGFSDTSSESDSVSVGKTQFYEDLDKSLLFEKKELGPATETLCDELLTALQKISDGMKKTKNIKHFAFEPFLAGSMRERTKTFAPDEADVILQIVDSASFEIENNDRSYSRIKVTGAQDSPWLTMCIQDRILDPRLFQTAFYEALDIVIKDSIEQESFQPIYMSKYSLERRDKISCLHILYRGHIVKDLILTVDIIPSICHAQYTGTFEMPYVKERPKFCLIPKVSRRAESRTQSTNFLVSYSEVETQLISSLPDNIRRGFIYAKAVRNIMSKQLEESTDGSDSDQEVLNSIDEPCKIDEYITTYLLKTCLMHLLTHKKTRKELEKATPVQIAAKIYEALRDCTSDGAVKFIFEKKVNLFKCKHFQYADYDDYEGCCVKRHLITELAQVIENTLDARS